MAIDRKVTINPVQHSPDLSGARAIDALSKAIGGAASVAVAFASAQQNKRAKIVAAESQGLPERITQQIWDPEWNPDDIARGQADFLATVEPENQPRAKALYDFEYRRRAIAEQEAQRQAADSRYTAAVNEGADLFRKVSHTLPDYMQEIGGSIGSTPQDMDRLAVGFARSHGIDPYTPQFDGFYDKLLSRAGELMAQAETARVKADNTRAIDNAKTTLADALVTWMESDRSPRAEEYSSLWEMMRSQYEAHGGTVQDARADFRAMVSGAATNEGRLDLLDNLPEHIYKGWIDLEATRSDIREAAESQRQQSVSEAVDTATSAIRAATTFEELQQAQQLVPAALEQMTDKEQEQAAFRMHSTLEQRFQTLRQDEATNTSARVKAMFTAMRTDAEQEAAEQAYKSAMNRKVSNFDGKPRSLLTDAEKSVLATHRQSSLEQYQKGRAAPVSDQQQARVSMSPEPAREIEMIAEEDGFVAPALFPRVGEAIASNFRDGLAFGMRVMGHLRTDNALDMAESIPTLQAPAMLKSAGFSNADVERLITNSSTAEIQAATVAARGVTISEDPDYAWLWGIGGVDVRSTAFDSFVQSTVLASLLDRPSPVDADAAGADRLAFTPEAVQDATRAAIERAKQQFPRINILGQQHQLQAFHVTPEVGRVPLEVNEERRKLIERQAQVVLGTQGWPYTSREWEVDFGGPRGAGLQEIDIQGETWLYAPVKVRGDDGFMRDVGKVFVPTSPEQVTQLKDVADQQVAAFREVYGTRMQRHLGGEATEYMQADTLRKGQRRYVAALDAYSQLEMTGSQQAASSAAQKMLRIGRSIGLDDSQIGLPPEEIWGEGWGEPISSGEILRSLMEAEGIADTEALLAR